MKKHLLIISVNSLDNIVLMQYNNIRRKKLDRKLQIYQKGQATIDSEIKRRMKQSKGGKIPAVCPYFILGKYNERIDVYDLSPIDIAILSLNRGDMALLNYIKPSQNITNFKQLRDVYNLNKLITKEQLANLLNSIIKRMDKNNLMDKVFALAQNNYKNLPIEDAIDKQLNLLADTQQERE